MEYDPTEVIQLSANPRSFLLWLDNEGFLNIRRRRCVVCRRPMHLAFYAQCGDGYCLRCNNWRCHAHQSVRSGSFFEGSHLPLVTQLLILIGFVTEERATSHARFLRPRKNTVLEYYQKARMVWSRDLQRDPITFESNSEYEVDEAAIQYVDVDNRGTRRTVWVGGILERETRKCKLYILPGRTIAEIIPRVEESIPSGSLVYTDALPAYHRLDESRTPYEHFTVNHSQNEYAREQDIGGETRVRVHINGMESLFARTRGKLGNFSRRYAGSIQVFLDEIMYRCSGRSLYNLFKTVPGPGTAPVP